MSENLANLFDNLPKYLGGHMRISLIALGIGIAISLPLAVIVTRWKAARWPVLTITGLIQTIPSLALLALMYPLLVVLIAALDLKISALGFLPAVIALTLYSMLPIVRNTVTGILGVDASLVEAARGMGMTDTQMLFKVELPLAAPVIIAGIRTATVWVVGIATLATPIGQTCLGNYIFTGLDMQNWASVLFGCAAAAALAIVLDTLIGQLEAAVRHRSRWRAILSGAGLVAVLIIGLVPASLKARAAASPAGARQAPIVVGSKNFTEQYILAALLEDRLKRAGLPVRRKEGLGSAVIFSALCASDVDCYVDYSGTIWLNHMKRTTIADRQTTLHEMTQWLADEQQARCLGELGFENTYALMMRRDRAARSGIGSIADLTAGAARMRIGGTVEFFGRPEWENLRSAYQLSFAEDVALNPTLMYQAAVSGDVDVISGFSSDGRIAAYDLKVLTDPKQVIPPYDAVLLLSPRVRSHPGVLDALRPLIGRISADLMRQANYMVDRDEDKKRPEEAAEWISRQTGLSD